jgi:transposase
MARRERRKFTDEYKAEVVALVRSSGKGIAAISRDLDQTETAVREWVQRADVDGGTRNGLSSAEREELTRLRWVWPGGTTIPAPIYQRIRAAALLP